jgi:DNA-binding transcriptional LysR family regulator
MRSGIALSPQRRGYHPGRRNAWGIPFKEGPKCSLSARAADREGGPARESKNEPASLVKRLAKSAPKVDLRVFPSNHVDLVQQLEKGRADLVIGSFTELPAGIRRTRLLRENEVITVRTGHPLTHGRMTKERLLEFPQVVVEPAATMDSVTDGFPDKERNGKRVSVERALYEFQYGRIGPGGRAVVCVPNLAAVAPFLQLSDMVAMLPHRLALWAAAHAPLALLDPPYTSITIEIETLWVEAADQDEGLWWLLSELAESIEDLG